MNMTSSNFKTVDVIAELIDEENKARSSSECSGVTLIGYCWVPGIFVDTGPSFQQQIDCQKFYFRADLQTDKFILIAVRGFYNFLSDNNAEPENLKFAEDLLDKSQVVTQIKDNTTRVDHSISPYNALHDNRGIGDLEIRRNYSTSSTVKTNRIEALMTICISI
jgi:hypothetical protein